MNFQRRKKVILNLITERGELTVKELADEVQVSEITIRRDLIALVADGLVFRTHGGAMKVELTQTPFDFANKVASNAAHKDQICRIAAREIQEGDTIFMDCGSTVFHLCQFIKHKKIRVITNSLPVAAELMRSEVQVNLVGGELDKERQAVHGQIAEEHISRYKANRAFVGIDGISAGKGLTAHSELEAGNTLAMLAQADLGYILCDSSKIGKDRYFQFAPLSAADVLITNERSKETDKMKKKGLRILV